MNSKNITIGERYGRLTVLGRGAITPCGYRWECRCDCGAHTSVVGASLTSGNTRSCGCLRRETTRIRASKPPETRATDHPLYTTWIQMRDRCYNANAASYKNYGGRGVRVCDEWNATRTGFWAFVRDMGPKPSAHHTLDRRHGDEGYCPKNCRWATPEEQSQNKRGLVLSPARVALIKAMLRTGRADEDIACVYGVKTERINAIRRNKEWRNVRPARLLNDCLENLL